MPHLFSTSRNINKEHILLFSNADNCYKTLPILSHRPWEWFTLSFFFSFWSWNTLNCS